MKQGKTIITVTILAMAAVSDAAPHLKAVHQEHGNRPALPAGLGEKNFLEVVNFLCHWHMKERTPMKQGKTIITVTILAMAAVVALYFGYYAYNALNEPYVTTQAYAYTAHDSVAAEGLVVRPQPTAGYPRPAGRRTPNRRTGQWPPPAAESPPPSPQSVHHRSGAAHSADGGGRDRPVEAAVPLPRRILNLWFRKREPL